MKKFSLLRVSDLYLALALIAVAAVGCGSNEPTVVQPGPDYQLSPDEVRMQAEIDAVPPPGERGFTGES